MASPRSSVVGQAVMAGAEFVAAVPSGEANAALIAAAPDLLDAARDAAELLLNCDGNETNAYRMLREAIAKAEARP